MKRLTLATLKASRLPGQLGVCSTSQKFIDLLNEAERRLMQRGTWWGCVQDYHICTTANGCLTWPRQVASIEAISVNDSPIKIRNGWFEYLESGYGAQSTCNSCEVQLLERGTAVTFEDITSVSDTFLQVYSVEVEDASARMLVQGYDENGNWITTIDNGIPVDGEYIAISQALTKSVNKFSAVTGVQKPVTAGEVYLQQTSVLAGDQVIGYYERDETNPEYRRSMIPGLGNLPAMTCGDGTSPLTVRRSVRVMVKLDHMDVSRDIDWFVIRNEAAFKLACQAIKFEDANQHRKAVGAWALAEDTLRKELEHFQGIGNVEPLRIESEDWGAGSIVNVQ